MALVIRRRARVARVACVVREGVRQSHRCGRICVARRRWRRYGRTPLWVLWTKASSNIGVSAQLQSIRERLLSIKRTDAFVGDRRAARRPDADIQIHLAGGDFRNGGLWEALAVRTGAAFM